MKRILKYTGWILSIGLIITPFLMAIQGNPPGFRNFLMAAVGVGILFFMTKEKKEGGDK
jgi:heme/copper-type cytochrome/quinol oxidase subunit 4